MTQILQSAVCKHNETQSGEVTFFLWFLYKRSHYPQYLVLRGGIWSGGPRRLTDGKSCPLFPLEQPASWLQTWLRNEVGNAAFLQETLPPVVARAWEDSSTHSMQVSLEVSPRYIYESSRVSIGLYIRQLVPPGLQLLCLLCLNPLVLCPPLGSVVNLLGSDRQLLFLPPVAFV